MISITVCRWVILRLATPWAVLCFLVLLGLVPLQQAFSPLPTPAGALALARLWALPASSLGVLASLVVLARGQPFLARLDPRSRLGAELGALTTAGLCLLFPTFAGALLGGARAGDVAHLAPAILASLLHLASVALLVLQPALSMALRLALFVTLTWVLPALSASAPMLAPVAAVFDANGPLRAATLASLVSSLAATAALVLACPLVRR